MTSVSRGIDSADFGDAVEVSVVIPCLNEAKSIGFCVDKALAAFREIGVAGEVVVADNGSVDKSVEIAIEQNEATALNWLEQQSET